MLATMGEAVKEYALHVGHERPYTQWILSDYDSWERNPFYVGPDQGHPEYGDPLCGVYGTFAEAAAQARSLASMTDSEVRVEHYNNSCWVVWYD